MEIMLVISLIGTLCVLISYLVIRYVTVTEQLEEEIVKLQEEKDTLIEFIDVIYQRVFEDEKKLNEVDKGGSFRSDDEVGFVFDSIHNIVIDLVAFIQKNINIIQTDAEEKER